MLFYNLVSSDNVKKIIQYAGDLVTFGTAPAAFVILLSLLLI